MTTITDEMVEAAVEALVPNAVNPSCRSVARAALEAALSALPDAGEGYDDTHWYTPSSTSMGRCVICRGAKDAPTHYGQGEPAPTYDAKLGEITEQDREYAADLIDDYKEEITGIDNADDDRKRQIETVAQWLRKIRHQAVIDDRKSRSEPAPDRNAVIEECAAICDELGDAEFAKIMKRGNRGIAILAQRHYMTCSTAIRALKSPVSAESK